MFIYETPPVDFFDGLMKLADYIKKEDDESNRRINGREATRLNDSLELEMT